MMLVLDPETKVSSFEMCVVLHHPGLLLKVNNVPILKHCVLCHLFEIKYSTCLVAFFFVTVNPAAQ